MTQAKSEADTRRTAWVRLLVVAALVAALLLPVPSAVNAHEDNTTTVTNRPVPDKPTITGEAACWSARIKWTKPAAGTSGTNLDDAHLVGLQWQMKQSGVGSWVNIGSKKNLDSVTRWTGSHRTGRHLETVTVSDYHTMIEEIGVSVGVEPMLNTLGSGILVSGDMGTGGGLTPATAYKFRFRISRESYDDSFNGTTPTNDWSAWSDEITLTTAKYNYPGFVKRPRVTKGSNSLTARWDAPTGTECYQTPTRYLVRYSWKSMYDWSYDDEFRYTGTLKQHQHIDHTSGTNHTRIRTLGQATGGDLRCPNWDDLSHSRKRQIVVPSTLGFTSENFCVYSTEQQQRFAKDLDVRAEVRVAVKAQSGTSPDWVENPFARYNDFRTSNWYHIPPVLTSFN